MKQKLSSFFPWIILFLYLYTNFFWIYKNTSPPPWDQAHYLESSELLFQQLETGNILGFGQQYLKTLPTKAPLIALIPLPFYFVFGSSPQSALLSHLLLAFFLLILVYKIAQKKFNSQVGLLAVIFLSTMPLFYGLLRHFFVELTLTFLVTLWIFLLLKYSEKNNNKMLILLGIVSGLGVLTKILFPMFVIGPFLLFIINEYKKQKELFQLSKKLLFICLPAVLIALPWYLKNILTVLWHARRASNPELLKSYYYGSFFDPSVLYFSLLDVINFVISSYYFLLFLILLIIILKTKVKISFNKMVLGWVLIPFFIFMIQANRDYRFILPILPGFAIILASLYYLVFNKSKTYYHVLILLMPILIYLKTIYIFPLNFLNNDFSVGDLVFYNQTMGYYVYKPNTISNKLPELISFLNNLPADKKIKTITALNEDQYMNINNLSYYSTKAKADLFITTTAYFSDPFLSDESLERINKSDYLIIKNPNLDQSEFTKLLEANPHIKNSNIFLFPDNSQLMILKVDKHD